MIIKLTFLKFFLNGLLPETKFKPHLVLKEQNGAEKETSPNINNAIVMENDQYAEDKHRYFQAESFQF